MLCLYYDVDQPPFALPVPSLVPVERSQKRIDSCDPRGSELFACTGHCGLRAMYSPIESVGSGRARDNALIPNRHIQLLR